MVSIKSTSKIFTIKVKESVSTNIKKAKKSASFICKRSNDEVEVEDEDDDDEVEDDHGKGERNTKY